MRYVRSLFVVVLLASTVSCQSGETGSQANEAEKQAEGESEATGGRMPIGDYGITGDVPAGAKVKDALSPGKAVQGGGFGVVVNNVDKAEKLEKVLGTKKALIDTVKNVQKKELEDGWVLTFVGKDEDGEKDYPVYVYREIGGGKFACQDTADDEKQQQKALEFCKSLESQGGGEGDGQKEG